MNEYIENFLGYLSVERGLAKNTLVAYRRDLGKYTQHLKSQGIAAIGEVKRAQITDYIFSQKKGGLAATSISRSLAAIKTFHRFLVREGLAKEDPEIMEARAGCFVAGRGRGDDQGRARQALAADPGHGYSGIVLRQRDAGFRACGVKNGKYPAGCRLYPLSGEGSERADYSDWKECP
jgi:hypothetical protein